MISGTLRALRFGRSWVGGRTTVVEREIEFHRREVSIPASLFLPAGGSRDHPGWVVLHGITRPGRRHRSLLRFARALASTPAAVLVPEVPEWTELRLDPELSLPTIKAAVLALDARPETAPGRVGLIGFSFGAPQGVIASTAPELEGHLKGVVGFGGYCDLERTLHFQFTGEHEWEGRTYRADPDPYGRWVVGANFLVEVPELSDAGDVADALRRLASEAGDLQIDARAPGLDPLKARLRDSVARARRHLFDLFAPETGARPDPREVARIIEVLGPAVRRTAPLMDPLAHLAPLTVPVRLIHGREDVLIPWSESARFRAALPRDADVGLRLTGLFAHSTGNRPPSALVRARESLQFLAALREVLELV